MWCPSLFPKRPEEAAIQICDPALQTTVICGWISASGCWRLECPWFKLPRKVSTPRFSIWCAAGPRWTVGICWMPCRSKERRSTSFRSASGFQIAVGNGFPAMPPDLGVLLVVPVHCAFLVALPVPRRELDALTVPVKVAHLRAFGSHLPCSSIARSVSRMWACGFPSPFVMEKSPKKNSPDSQQYPFKQTLPELWINTVLSALPPGMPARCAGQAGSSTGSPWFPRRSRALPGLHIRAAHGTAA